MNLLNIYRLNKYAKEQLTEFKRTEGKQERVKN